MYSYRPAHTDRLAGPAAGSVTWGGKLPRATYFDCQEPLCEGREQQRGDQGGCGRPPSRAADDCMRVPREVYRYRPLYSRTVGNPYR
jgi:hypothetical protein